MGSKNSKTTSFKKRLNSIAQNSKEGPIDAIEEENENAVIYDKEGNVIELT